MPFSMLEWGFLTPTLIKMRANPSFSPLLSNKESCSKNDSYECFKVNFMFYICILSTNGNAIKYYSLVIAKHFKHILPLVMFTPLLVCCKLLYFAVH